MVHNILIHKNMFNQTELADRNRGTCVAYSSDPSAAVAVLVSTIARKQSHK